MELKDYYLNKLKDHYIHLLLHMEQIQKNFYTKSKQTVKFS